MEYGKLGFIGGLCLAAYLLVVGVGLLVGIAIPGWAIGCLSVAAGVLILIGR